MKYIFIIAIVLFISSTLFGQQPTVFDSTKYLNSKKIFIDTTQQVLQKDTLINEKDSIIRIVPIPLLGSVLHFTDSSKTIFDSDIIWKEYRSLTDLLWQQPHFYIRDISSPGQNNNITVGGIDNGAVSILVDGRSHAEPFSGRQNVWLIPVDAIERIEIISGPSAFFYGSTAAVSTINIVSKSYNTNKPFSRLRYSQGIDGYTQTDALFTQNIFRGFNLTIGLGHLSYGSKNETESNKGRYANANDDDWNIRTKMRYNFSDDVNIVFSYLYNKTWTGLNGGVDLLSTNPADVFNGIIAKVYNYESYEKIENHHSDLTIAFRPFKDSTELITISGYTSALLREYRDDENRNRLSQLNGILKKIDFDSQIKGVKFQYQFNPTWNRFLTYIKYEESSLNKKTNDISSPLKLSDNTIGVKNDFLFLAPLSFSIYAVSHFSKRANSSEEYIDLGSETTLQLTRGITFFGGLSQSNHSYYNSVLAPSNGYSTIGKQEIYTIIEAGTRFSISDFIRGSVSLLHQEINNPYVMDTVNFGNSTAYAQYYIPAKKIYNGISITAHVMYNDFHFEGLGNYLQQPKVTRGTKDLVLSPELFLDGSIYYRGVLAKGNLDLKVGFRGRFISKQNGMRPYDELEIWIPYSLSAFGPSGAVDFFAIGKIGDAHVHLMWENITSNDYLLSPVYPMMGPNIRFGVSWGFFD